MVARSPVDPRTPVLVGAGQFVQRVDDVAAALHPVAMMCEAIQSARSDAGLGGIPDVDAVAVVSLLSWRHGDPAYLVAEQLGIKTGATMLTPVGGNSPQSLVNAMASRIQEGDLDIAVLAGGEAWRTRMRARRLGIELDWPKAAAEQHPAIIGDELEMTHPAEEARGVRMPVQMYPMFETAIRAAAGRSVE